jgi:phosphatidylethanolamine-binding protein (PEBP) family uncharacterized protein
MPMRKPSRAVRAGALACAAALAGCGSSLPSAATTATVPRGVVNLRVNGRLPTLELESPGLYSGSTIQVGRTCDEQGLPPALKWSEPPFGTTELALFVLRVPESGGNGISLQWAAAGMSSTLREVQAGKLPAGAVLGDKSGHGPFFACPRPGKSASYLFLLYALTARHALRPGFDEDKLFVPTYSSSTPFGALILDYARA